MERKVVSTVSDRIGRRPDIRASGSRRRTGTAPAHGRLYAVLVAAAEAGAPCPSNPALRDLAGLSRESEVTTVLSVLRERGAIAVEWSVPANGARRIAIVDRGVRTGWSRHGPQRGGHQAVPADGAKAMGLALGPNRRFADVTRAEARAIAARSPADRGAPPLPQGCSPVACALADLRGNPEFDEK